MRWPRTNAVYAGLAAALTVWALVPIFTDTAQSLEVQPFPDSAEYADGAWQLAHGHGYVTFVNEGASSPLFASAVPSPPRYPFGTSVALAPFQLVIGHFPRGVQVGSRAISAAYVIALVWAAWLLGGPLAGAVGALLVGLSPFAHVSATLILSDALGALLTVAVLIALIRGSRRSIAIAGALVGAILTVRTIGIILLPALFVAIGRDKQRIALALLCGSPFVLALAIYQWHTFGSPLRTGYGYWVPGLKLVDPTYITGLRPGDGPFIIPDKLNGDLLSSVCPCGAGGPMSQMSNVPFYASVLAGAFWIFAPPLTSLIGLARVVRRRTTPAARFVLVAVGLNFALLAVYYSQGARLLAPAASLLLVYSAAAIADAADRVRRWARSRVSSPLSAAALTDVARGR